MPEVAVNVPFESNEIVEIAVEEFRKRLKQLGPIQGAKEYAKFMLDFQVKIKLWRTGDTGLAKETLAWGHHEGNPQQTGEGLDVEDAGVENSSFESKDPNEERISREMPLTVETRDGRGNVTRKKVNVKR